MMYATQNPAPGPLLVETVALNVTAASMDALQS